MKHTDDKERAAILALNERLARSAYRAGRNLSEAQRRRLAFIGARVLVKMGYGAVVDGESVRAAAAVVGNGEWQ